MSRFTMKLRPIPPPAAADGNVGVVRATMGELTDTTNRAQVYIWTYTARVGSGHYRRLRDPVGTTARLLLLPYSPFVGGWFAHPHERFPVVFQNWLREEHPYFLPCFFSAFSFVITWLLLREVRGFARDSSVFSGLTHSDREKAPLSP